MKHLQANLSSLYKPALPKLPNITLPSGVPYIRKIPLAAMPQLTYYSYDTYPTPKINLYIAGLKDTYYLNLQKPRVVKPQTKGLNWQQMWFAYDKYHIKYFRTQDEAYIDMFVVYLYTRNYFPAEFTNIKLKYPEYFI